MLGVAAMMTRNELLHAEFLEMALFQELALSSGGG